jgi:hypothetical protein
MAGNNPDSFQECLEGNVSDPIEYSRQLSKEIARVEGIANQGGNGIGKDGATNTPEADIPWGNNAITEVSEIGLDDGTFNTKIKPFRGPYGADGILLDFVGSANYSIYPAYNQSLMIQSESAGLAGAINFLTKSDDGTDEGGFAVARRSGAANIGSDPLEFFSFYWRPSIGQYSIDQSALFGGSFYPIRIGANAHGSTPNLLLQTDGSTEVKAGDLKLDNNLRVTGNMGVGNSAAATSLGSVTKKMEIFDAAGVSLGFVPIYDAIT